MSLVAPATMLKASIAVLEKLRIGAIKANKTEIPIPLAGTPFGAILAKLSFSQLPFLASCANWKKCRPAEKMVEFKAEAALVKTTKFRTEAAVVKPANWKTWTKGLLEADTDRQGTTHMITVKVPM